MDFFFQKISKILFWKNFTGEEPPVDLKAALSRNDKDDDKENTKKEESKRSRYL